MVNTIVIVGRLTKDPKFIEKEDTKLATFCVAVERNYKDKDQQRPVDFLFCKAFGRIANNIATYTEQGSLVGITGQMHSRTFEKEDQTHFVSELYVEKIKFLSAKPDKQTSPMQDAATFNVEHEEDISIEHLIPFKNIDSIERI
ncbi:single-stranded DNA-binding protein [Staphylococcus auricularis]|uniref:Single-stranded DNA-binding protein n=1 Tax=Staphylococcus auricularis TaxID=29379 RepID=A0ABX5IGP8_9STAP|nr:single-stranded DNA-binding protein [Staphylococcus auricularis]MCE5039290.1 single-stranded DNA-binding protein [Staphylococcus auricularis]PTH19480.1 single-stranded DNA-binding protein [Staphylococcus auricularis]PTH26726.1 single-stranded DNA-binding protein [Staphylococcus auricularis]